MKKSPSYIKLIAIIGLIFGIFGMYLSINVSGNISLAPSLSGLILGILAFLISKAKNNKCYGGWVAIIISIIGIISAFFTL